MANLTKRNLIIQISNETGMVQNQVREVIQKTLDAIMESLAEGTAVELRNFGIFEVWLSKPRVGRNPADPSNLYNIPARTNVRFKMGKVMRQKVSRMTSALKRQGKV